MAQNLAEIFLYGYIGWDVSASEFLNKLRESEKEYSDITIRMNSGGGDVFEGLPMYNNIKSSPSNITVIIDGLAASMATIIMCGGKKIKAARNAMIMVHGPRGGDYNTVENLEQVVDLMKKNRNEMALIYAQRTGKTEQWVLDNWLVDGLDHWFTAEEAKQAGLIDEVIESELSESPQASWPLKRIAAFYSERLSISNYNKPNQSSMKNLIAKLNGLKLQGVSLADNATEADVMLALDGVINKNRTLAELTQSQAGEITQLKAEKETLEGKVAEAEQKSKDDKAVLLVDSAVAAKKITAASKDLYLKLAKADYESTKLMLDSLKGYQAVSESLTQTGSDDSDEALSKKYDELHKAGKLEAVKQKNPEEFKALYKARWGKEYKA